MVVPFYELTQNYVEFVQLNESDLIICCLDVQKWHINAVIILTQTSIATQGDTDTLNWGIPNFSSLRMSDSLEMGRELGAKSFNNMQCAK